MSISSIIKSLEQNNIKKPHFRFAPSPNGNVTFGHLKGLVLLDKLRLETKGILDLRFDDTNPRENYKKSYYDSVLNLSHQLGIKFDNIYQCSTHLELYVSMTEKLFYLKKAYFCHCDLNTGDFTKKCPCARDFNNQDINILYEKPSCVVKFIPLEKEPFVILRGINNTWYPTIALQGPIDDFFQGINVIVRGRDLESLSFRQKEIHYALFPTHPYPLESYWGRISLWNSKSGKIWSISKSLLKESIKFPSLEFFTHWGVTYDMLKDFVLSYGYTKNDIKLDLLKLTHYILKKLPSTVSKKLAKGYCKYQNYWGYCNNNYFLNYKLWIFYKIKP